MAPRRRQKSMAEKTAEVQNLQQVFPNAGAGGAAGER